MFAAYASPGSNNAILSFLDGMLRFVTAIAGWIFLPVGCFFRQSKLA